MRKAHQSCQTLKPPCNITNISEAFNYVLGRPFQKRHMSNFEALLCYLKNFSDTLEIMKHLEAKALIFLRLILE